MWLIDITKDVIRPYLQTRYNVLLKQIKLYVIVWKPSFILPCRIYRKAFKLVN